MRPGQSLCGSRHRSGDTGGRLDFVQQHEPASSLFGTYKSCTGTARHQHVPVPCSAFRWLKSDLFARGNHPRGPVSYGDVCNRSSTPDRPHRPHRCDASLFRRRHIWRWNTPQDTAPVGRPPRTRVIILLPHQSGKILALRERSKPSGGQGHVQREWPEHHHKGSPAPWNTTR